jgi:flagellar hook assembly protein FlgD
VTYSSIIPFTLTETLTVKNSAGSIVRTLVNAASRTANTYNDVWNGKNDSAGFLPDGPYFYVATVTDGTHTLTWDLTNQYYNDLNGELGVTTTGWDPFNNTPITVTYTSTQASRVNLAFKPSDGGGCSPPSFCPTPDKYEESGSHTVYWAGVDATGALRFDIHWIEAGSSRAIFSKNAVVLFGSKPTVTNVRVTPAMYGPAVGTQTVAFDLASPPSLASTVTVTFLNQGSVSVLRTITLTAQSPGHKTVTWDGHGDNGMWVAPGFYTVTVSATDSLGNQAQGQILTTLQY